jgi:hypothetical protein
LRGMCLLTYTPSGCWIKIRRYHSSIKSLLKIS